jgi:hypothetical protein
MHTNWIGILNVNSGLQSYPFFGCRVDYVQCLTSVLTAPEQKGTVAEVCQHRWRSAVMIGKSDVAVMECERRQLQALLYRTSVQECKFSGYIVVMVVSAHLSVESCLDPPLIHHLTLSVRLVAPYPTLHRVSGKMGLRCHVLLCLVSNVTPGSPAVFLFGVSERPQETPRLT